MTSILPKTVIRGYFLLPSKFSLYISTALPRNTKSKWRKVVYSYFKDNWVIRWMWSNKLEGISPCVWQLLKTSRQSWRASRPHCSDTRDMLVYFMTEMPKVTGNVQKHCQDWGVGVWGGGGKRKRVRINFLWEECGCYPSQLESAGSHTRGMVNI